MSCQMACDSFPLELAAILIARMLQQKASCLGGFLVQILFVALVSGCVAQKSAPGTPGARDPQIAEMLVEIDPQRIRENIETLASFKTRHTYSETESKSEGIIAARNWIKSQFDSYANASTG